MDQNPNTRVVMTICLFIVVAGWIVNAVAEFDACYGYGVANMIAQSLSGLLIGVLFTMVCTYRSD